MSKSAAPSQEALARLPSGSFTVAADGHVLTSTLPQSFGAVKQKEISQAVLKAFRGAQLAGLPMTELVVQYPGIKITAREMRGGAIIFLAPQTLKRA
ncbi:MAG: hypothetical protein H7X97_11795 [Opitutaceae bacterium]|nr:hypothetical protein [Verrucomicrobiales bacterium]